jgi:hypothetical protein
MGFLDKAKHLLSLQEEAKKAADSAAKGDQQN